MLKKLLASTVAFSMAFAPMASADTYMFRYKTPLVAVSAQPGDGEQYGVGNDIHAYYTVPVGYDFEKRIPVATQDVVEWRKDSGEWPDGIDLDETTGEMTGSPTSVEKQTLLYHGYDVGGNRIARAELNFSVFKPVGAGEEIAYYAHTGHYFYEKLPIPQGVDVYRWESVTDFPAGVSASGLALSGTPAKAGTYGLAFRGYDFMGREVAFLYGDLLVEDGPKVEPIGDQEIDLLADESFDISPIVEHSIGNITYALVAENGRPKGLTFSSQTGEIGGAYETVDTSATFHVVATDTADGTSSPSNSFTLSTLPATVDLSQLGDQQGAVNAPFSLQLSFPGVQPGATWSLKQGSWPAGISLDEKTGLISGTPTKAQTMTGLVVSLSGPSMTTVESPAFSFEIFPEKLTAQTNALIARVDKSFATTPPVVMTGNVAPVTYSVKESSENFARMAAQSLVSVDPSTGKVVSNGIPTPGSYGVTLVAVNGEGQRSSPLVQGIEVYAPQGVAYADGQARRLESFVLAPVVPDDSVAAPGVYRLSSGILPSWLSFDPATGRFSGTPTDPSSVGTFGPFVVEISDRSGEKTSSNPFMIEVGERTAMTARLVDSNAERLVKNGKIAVAADNAWQEAVWTVKSGAFPTAGGTTLAFTRDGYLSGTTSDPAGTTYGPFVLTATDGDGQTSDVGPFAVTVVEPTGLKPLRGSFDASLTWTRGVPFTLDLPALSNAYGATTYAFSDVEPHLGISQADGRVSGVIDEAGVTVHGFTVKDDTGRAPAAGTITLVMLDPMTVHAEPEYVGNQGAEAKFQPVVTNSVGKVVYGPLSGTLPKGLKYSKGVISGEPEALGVFGPYSFSVSDEPGNRDVATFSIRIDPPLPFSFSYNTKLMTQGYWSDRGPKAVNRIGTVKYSLVSGILPKGVKLAQSKYYNGHLVGTPKETGRFPGIVVSGTDPNYDLSSTADDLHWTTTVDLGVKPPYSAKVPAQTFKVHKDVKATVTLATDYVVAPLSFDPKPGTVLPYGLALDGTAGTLTGVFPEVGKFSATKIQVTDTFDRKASGTITFDVLDGVAVSYPDEATFNLYGKSSVGAVTENLIGTASYALDTSSSPLPAGLAVNQATGAIEGVPTVTGEFPGVVVAVVDGFDGSRSTSAPVAVKVADRLKFALQSPGDVALKRWQTSTVAVTAINAIGATTFAISPSLPSGLSLDPSTGVISGFSADVVPEASYVVTATDSRGGSDSVSFKLRVDERDALGIETADDYVFAQYFSDTFAAQAVNAIGKPTWSISPSLPAWATFKDGAVSGQPQSKAAATVYTLTLSDDHDTVTKAISVSVGDRKALEIAEPHVVGAILNSTLSAPLAATNSVGKTTWKLVSGTTPPGVFFDEATGAFKGLPTQFGTFADLVVEATDAFGGSAQANITVDVKADSTPLGITVPYTFAHAGQAYQGLPPKVADAIGTTTFTATGLSGTGLTIDPDTGVVSGVPASEGRLFFTVTVEDTAGRKGVAAGEIYVLGSLSVSAPANMQLVYNYTPGSEAAATATNAATPVTWALASGTLPAGVTVDPATGRLVGKPRQIGSFGPVSLSATDSTGVMATSAGITVVVTMNGDPISLSTSDFSTHVGYPVSTRAPVVDNELGTATFFSTDASTFGLTLDPATGVLSGRFDQTLDAYVNVSVRDSGTSRVTSRTVHVTVVPPQQITAPSVLLVTVNESTNKSFLTRQYAVGGATWSQLSNASALPPGITFDPTTGNIVGTATTLGTYGPFTATSTDGTGDVQTSNSFSLQVTTGSAYLGLAQGPVPAGQKRTVYPGYDFSQLLTAVGIDQSEMKWSLTADAKSGEALPPGLTITDGRLAGTPTAEGSFAFKVKVTGGGQTAMQSYVVDVTLPATTLTLAATTLPPAGLKVAYSDDFTRYATVVNVPRDKLTWTMTAVAGTPVQTLPAGIALGSTTGLFSGAPTKAPVTSDATLTFTVTVSFKDGTENLSSSAVFKLPFKTGGVVQAVTGGTNSCYLTMAGGVKCAGNGASGENGSGTTGSRVTATDVTGLTSGVSQIDSGNAFVCALTDAGGVKCWGLNSSGQLGDTTTSSKSTPVNVTGLGSGVEKVSTGFAHACALMGDQSIKCWGANAYGQIGIGNTTAQKSPVSVDVGGPVADVAAGYNNTCALLVDGTVKCWGANNYYQLGNVGTANKTTPFEITGYTGTAMQVTTGSGYTCVLNTEGKIQCIGLNLNGRLGDGTTGTTSTPKKTFVTALVSDVKMMDAGITTVCAVTNANAVYCWGDNTYGNVGDGTTTDRATPLRLPQLDGKVWTQINVNDDHQCASSDQGVGMCWGWGAQGRLGNAVDSAKAFTPVVVVF